MSEIDSPQDGQAEGEQPEQLYDERPKMLDDGRTGQLDEVRLGQVMGKWRGRTGQMEGDRPLQGDGETPSPFLVVALGASAGGFRPLQQFFEQLPQDSNMAFVVVMHLAPEYESHLASLLQTTTKIPVVQVNEPMRLQPNQVFVAPPNRNVELQGDELLLSPLEQERAERAPIDHFFRSLAAAYGASSVCVVLSGTGTDGTLGLRRVKEVGGLTVAQDPADSEYSAMPQSAIATGEVELVLPTGELAPKLVEYARTAAQTLTVPSEAELPEGERELMQKVLTQVRARSGYDFSRYKYSTLLRRIQRRMQLHGYDNMAGYLAFVREHADEAQTLFADFLITVTNFFRDAEAFAVLEQEVIPELFRDKTSEDQVRVWVTGCATGEEAYSLGILLLEYAHQTAHAPGIQIFATDLSEVALRRAREGIYPDSIQIDVNPARLARFFTKEQGGYRVRQELRELVLFAPHSLLKDPPFSKIDLISCRNVLIYLQRSVQKQLFELFHYSLRPDGYLFLGSAETVDDVRFYRDGGGRHGIFQRQPIAPNEVRLPSLPLAIAPPQITVPATQAEPQRVGSYEKLYVQLMERYGPPSLVVNSDYSIVYFADDVTRYLYQPRGEPTNNILRRVREELRVDLTTGLYRAFEHGEASLSAPVLLQFGATARSIAVDVRPARDANLKGYVLVLFHEFPPQHDTSVGDTQGTNRQTLTALEEELQEVRRRLQVTVEQYEISKEEMRAANEELQSMNEELRSTAEELETSKAELQSINEELLTVNQENKSKIDELSQLTSDLQNLLASTDIATLFLDRDMRIKRFTPRIAEIFNVLAGDRGRPLAHITHKLRYPDLLKDAQTVLQTLVPMEQEISSEDSRWYAIRLLPYRTVDDRIDGVVITLVDITQHRAANEKR
jgi:two-component system, chemotaxis family, CheB/CheR fusion protein